MTDERIKQTDAFMKSYNKALRENYDSYFKTQGLYNDNQDALDMFIESVIKEWEAQPVPELENNTPREFLDKIEDINTLAEMVEHISTKRRDRIPDCLMDRLTLFGDEAAQLMLEKLDIETIEKCEFNSSKLTNEITEKFEFSIAIFVIFEKKGFGGEKAIKKLLEAISRCRPSNELVIETIAGALRERIDESRGLIIGHINSCETIGEGEEHLLSILCDTEDEHKSDEIYICLKKSFLRMPNHMMGAVFLGDYGDSRAIPAMRRFAAENLGKCKMEEYYTVLAAIEKLGGLVEDLLPPKF